MNARPRIQAALRTILALAALAVAAAGQHATTRVSVASDGTEADGSSWIALPGYSSASAVSADGRFVAFESDAKNLVSGDTNAARDVFVHDRATGATVRVSVDSSGNESASGGFDLSISADGRVVAFASLGDDLVAGDTNGRIDVFVHDRDPDANGIFDEGNGVTTRVSVSSSGTEGNNDSLRPAISADGNLVVFMSDADNFGVNDQNQATDIFLHNRATGQTTRMSMDNTSTHGGNQKSFSPAISSDGSCVSFVSDANNLVPGDTNRCADVFVRDRVKRTTERVSVDSSGAQGNDHSFARSPLSADGSVISFMSFATNLVAGDTNGVGDVFRHDRATGTTTRLSIDSAGIEGDNESESVALSDDGRIVVFKSYANNFVAGDTNGLADIFLHDVTTGTTSCVSLTCWGAVANLLSEVPAISGDGLVVAYGSLATDLVAGDINGFLDVFAFDRTAVEPDAAWSSYGAGLAGTLGVPTLTASGDPEFGASITVDVGNSLGAATIGFLFVGEAAAAIPTKYGASLLVDLDFLVPVALGPSGASLPFVVPYDPALCGYALFAQALELDAGASKGVSFTAGLELDFGK